MSKRVLLKWEKLVEKALVRSTYNRDGRGRGTNPGLRGERAPQSLAQQTDIDAVLQAADEIGHDNLQVARILDEHALKLTQQLDPRSEGRGVLQFKTALKSIIKQKQQARQGDVVDRSQDIRILQIYYKHYREMHKIDQLEEEARNPRLLLSTDQRREQDSDSQDMSVDKLRRVYEISRILNDVVDTLLKEAEPGDASRLQDTDEKRVMEEDARKLKGFKPYNILPLKTPMDTPTVLNAFDYFPEVEGSTQLLIYTQDLPRFPSDYEVPEDRVLDLFDFLHYAFGFQKDNVANQREHITLLLASAQSRLGSLDVGRDGDGTKLNLDKAISNVHERILENYVRWCHFLRREPQNKRAFTQQRRLILTALYLLVWGEAANLRFMPECLCYIFHHLADECIDLLGRTFVDRSKIVKANPDGSMEFSFLEQVIQPVYDVVAAEAIFSQGGKVPHSHWRNYDDFNEYFWQPNCFVELGWPWRTDAGFFKNPKLKSARRNWLQAPPPDQEPNPEIRGRRRKHKVGKVHFVEHRSGFHIYHSFHRLWIFLVCMLQGLTIWAFCSKNGNLNLHVRTIKKIMSVGPTFVIMKFIQSVFDIVFMWGAFKATRMQTVARMLLRFLWFTCLSGAVLFLYIKTLEEDARNDGSGSWFRIYWILIASYAGANVVFVFLLRIPFLQRQAAKCSNVYLFQFFKWLHQERYYVGRSMYERTRNYFKYSLFWIVVLICKFAFTMHFQIIPLVDPTRSIIGFNDIVYKWPDFVSDSNHNALTIVSLWAPVIMIYFLDTQIWYTVISAVLGGVEGARDKLGEIRTLEMLRKRFPKYPGAYVKRMQPPLNRFTSVYASEHDTSRSTKDLPKKQDAIRFQPIWNNVIKSLREEDLINNREKVLLKMPPNSMFHSNGKPNDLIYWPLFLLANKVHIAVELAVEHKSRLEELWEKVHRDEYMAYAVREAFATLEPMLLSVLNPAGQNWVRQIFEVLNRSLRDSSFHDYFSLNKLRDVLEKLRDLTEHLGYEDVPERRKKATTSFFQLYDVVMRDFITGQFRAEFFDYWREFQEDLSQGVLFTDLTWPTKAGQKQAKRLNNLLTVQKIKDQEGKTKTLNTETIPHNLEARRRLQFFTNSLFMHMPQAPPVRKMFSFCVFTPYYEEDVMYDMEKLSQENEDGITILFYLQKIYPDEWQNFLERIGLIENIVFREIENRNEKVKLDLRLWASYRGQTLARTVRGMMYYKAALIIQGMQEESSSGDLEEGDSSSPDAQAQARLEAQAQAELKFTYVVTCQIYGDQKRKGKVQAADILYLMQMHDSLRIAYVDVVESSRKGAKPSYYSKLCKFDKADASLKDQEVYSIKLPGDIKLGEGKPENQNHAIIFTRGDCIQTIDMNQDNFLEEAFKMRNLLQEFSLTHHGLHKPTILGVREHVFTGSVSSLAWFMSMQESSFVTLGQRVLARPLKVRMHYGHPDVFDRVFHITRGGISKASRVINLSEDIFAGFNTTLRLGNVTHHEYIEVGKGRDVGLNQIALFEAKVASGNGEQTLSRDVYRLGQLLDFPRMLSFFYTSIGFYVTTMMTVLTLYVFLYGKAYLALSGVDASLKRNSEILQNPALESALNTQFLFQIGIFTAVPMIVNLILEQGILKAIISFCTMQLQLASVFFTFSLGTRSHYFGRTILHGGAKYRSTGRGFVVTHIHFAENYRSYSRSHFTKALEIIMLLIIYLAYGAQNRTSVTFILLTFSSWFLALSWLFAPYIFNPSGFEWQKTVEDFDDWTNWMFYKGGVGVKVENSWEAWWFDEQDHIRSPRGRMWEFILSLRFFLFQYGVVYSLSVTRGSNSILVYAYSWLVIIGLVIIFKVFTVSQKASANFQLAVRLFQGLLFVCLIAGLVVSIVLSPLTVGDVFALALALVPTGWGLLSIAIAFRPLMERMHVWKSVREIARVYDACMGMIIFIPIAFLSWFPFVSTFQTRLVFNQAFSRGLEISLILSGNRPNRNA
jgi:callose synthase